MPDVLPPFEDRLREAVATYWKTLNEQSAKQRSGDADRGGRSGATGGKQMDGFCRLVEWLLTHNGLPQASIHVRRSSLEVPGYFRPTKQWDLLVVHEHHLVAAAEFKSHKGPSFGNNANNRTEEALGSAIDLLTAWQKGAFGSPTAQPRPWIGWVMLLEDCPESRSPVKPKEPHFKVFPEFSESSYAQRYELLARRLVLEKHYDASALVMATEKDGPKGIYTEPATDLTMKRFLASLAGHIAGYAALT